MATYSDPALILPGAVGQTELDAASKKDVIGGVAALDASGFVLAKGGGIAFPRTGSDDVHIYERTAGEEAYAFHRAGADDYTFFIKESNVWKQFQTESMKNVANGIAGLDASGLILSSVLPPVAALSAIDTYAGNSTVNRAIPHGLSKAPKVVLIYKDGVDICYIIVRDHGYVRIFDANATGPYAVTPVDDTNFYVGNASSYNGSANVTGGTFKFAVIA